MPTQHQQLGESGENAVCKLCSCPSCKRAKTLKRLPRNFKCADVICDFCGFLAQVKATRSKKRCEIPDKVLGAAWAPQKERMDAGIYFPLFLVIFNDDYFNFSIYYLSADLQEQSIFEPRKPLRETARRAGWQGFLYNLRTAKDRFVRVYGS
ncbi:DpnI domain-containing protein [Algihabitans albus]|uniref:DpnI domain-containing protein n=1 Tax=Algihabitans albus TaxID=2164067 RepID=UPI000E5D39A6